MQVKGHILNIDQIKEPNGLTINGVGTPVLETSSDRKGVRPMKASEFQAVAEARQAAEVRLSFFNRMMAAKTAAKENGAAGKPVTIPLEDLSSDVFDAMLEELVAADQLKAKSGKTQG